MVSCWGGKRDQTKVFDTLFEDGLIVFYGKAVIGFLAFNETPCYLQRYSISYISCFREDLA